MTSVYKNTLWYLRIVIIVNEKLISHRGNSVEIESKA